MMEQFVFQSSGGELRGKIRQTSQRVEFKTKFPGENQWR
jgi:hypothetical protein